MRDDRARLESRVEAPSKVMTGPNDVITNDQPYGEQERSIVWRPDASGSAVKVVTEPPNEREGVSTN